MIDKSKLGATISWLIAGAQPPKSVDEIVEECAFRMIEIGIPIELLIVNGLFIHLQIRGMQVRWSKKNGRSRQTFTHEYMNSHMFHEIPTAECINTMRALRCGLSPSELPGDSDYLIQFANAGYTELFLMPLINFDGTVSGAIEVATRQTGGFSDEHLFALRRLQAPLARMKEYFTENFDKQITLATYVGEKTSRQVLKGNIILGGGETISAVILFADIAGFTEISNSSPSEVVLNTLNTFFAAIDEAVEKNNGEILKFMGDGALAIFQTPDDLTAQEAAASSAVDAVALARKTLAEKETNPTVEFRASLHIGDLFFGNIGSKSRLDFTAIGPTVNMASRMLDEASRRNAKTVCSKDFLNVAIGLNADAIECHFKGFEQPEAIYILE